MREEIEQWLRLKMVRGKYSAGLVSELTAHYVNRTLHVHMILDEIANLEGAAGAKRSMTEDAKPLGGPLAGLWHKHFMQPAYIAQNLKNYWTPKRLGRAARKYPTEQLLYQVILGGYAAKAGNAAPNAQPTLTGEWIVYAKQGGCNYYLTLGLHGHDLSIWERCKACAAEFPELIILRNAT